MADIAQIASLAAGLNFCRSSHCVLNHGLSNSMALASGLYSDFSSQYLSFSFLQWCLIHAIGFITGFVGHFLWWLPLVCVVVCGELNRSMVEAATFFWPFRKRRKGNSQIPPKEAPPEPPSRGAGLPPFRNPGPPVNHRRLFAGVMHG